MSLALAERPSLRATLKRFLPWIGMAVCLAFLATHLVLDVVRRRAALVDAAPSIGTSKAPLASAGSTSPSPASTVTITDAKLKAAKIETEPARFEQISTELGVPGRIEVNSDRRVEIRPRAAGIVREVHVVLGQSVKRGDPLVTLDSPDVGTARLNLRSKQRELTTARIEADWRTQIASSVALLVPEIRKGTDPSAIEKQFADKPLGSYRGSLLQAYAEYDIAAHEEEKTASLRSNAVIGEHPVLVARHTREGLQQKLGAIIEQVRYDSAQERRLADQRLRRAESEVIDAAQRLRILGVHENIQELLDHADRANDLSVDEDVTVYRIESPFDGSIIARNAVPSQKADPNDSLFTLADLSTVWLNANIAESDVAKLPKVEGGSIRFTATSYPSSHFTAVLLAAGAMVDPQTRTLPLLAQTDNRERLLKPGMFVRILLDSPTSEQALTVPRSAVVEVEGKPVVFLPAEPATENHHVYKIRHVEIGPEAGDRVAIRSGLSKGQTIVSSGVFLLKSELILQSQQGDE